MGFSIKGEEFKLTNSARKTAQRLYAEGSFRQPANAVDLGKS